MADDWECARCSLLCKKHSHWVYWTKDGSQTICADCTVAEQTATIASLTGRIEEQDSVIASLTTKLKGLESDHRVVSNLLRRIHVITKSHISPEEPQETKHW